MKIKMLTGKSSKQPLTAEGRWEEEKALNIPLTPLTLVIKSKHASRVTPNDIMEAFTRLFGRMDERVSIRRFYIDPEPYYHAYSSGGESQMSPIAIVSLWYFHPK